MIGPGGDGVPSLPQHARYAVAPMLMQEHDSAVIASLVYVGSGPYH